MTRDALLTLAVSIPTIVFVGWCVKSALSGPTMRRPRFRRRR